MTTRIALPVKCIACCGLLLLAPVFVQQFCLAQKLNAVQSKKQILTVQPRLTIVSPKHMQTFGHDPVVVDVSVENFKLLQPEPYFGEPNPKPLGHIHYYLDSNPVIATNSRKILLGSNIDGENLTAGEHSLTVELVHDNHSPLNPRVYKRVVFLIKDYSTDGHGSGEGEGGFSGHVK